MMHHVQKLPQEYSVESPSDFAAVPILTRQSQQLQRHRPESQSSNSPLEPRVYILSSTAFPYSLTRMNFSPKDSKLGIWNESIWNWTCMSVRMVRILPYFLLLYPALLHLRPGGELLRRKTKKDTCPQCAGHFSWGFHQKLTQPTLDKSDGAFNGQKSIWRQQPNWIWKGYSITRRKHFDLGCHIHNYSTHKGLQRMKTAVLRQPVCLCVYRPAAVNALVSITLKMQELKAQKETFWELSFSWISEYHCVFLMEAQMLPKFTFHLIGGFKQNLIQPALSMSPQSRPRFC